MAKFKRNAPCPCGSGRKYKSCCGALGVPTPPSPSRARSRLKGLSPGLRMKGGVRYDEECNGYIAIVHIWDNIHARGEPDEWRADEAFPTEDAAMQYYKTTIRPELERMQTSGTVSQRRLE